MFIVYNIFIIKATTKKENLQKSLTNSIFCLLFFSKRR